jgi:hypothetical protein
MPRGSDALSFPIPAPARCGRCHHGVCPGIHCRLSTRSTSVCAAASGPWSAPIAPFAGRWPGRSRAGCIRCMAKGYFDEPGAGPQKRQAVRRSGSAGTVLRFSPDCMPTWGAADGSEAAADADGEAPPAARPSRQLHAALKCRVARTGDRTVYEAARKSAPRSSPRSSARPVPAAMTRALALRFVYIGAPAPACARRGAVHGGGFDTLADQRFIRTAATAQQQGFASLIWSEPRRWCCGPQIVLHASESFLALPLMGEG